MARRARQTQPPVRKTGPVFVLFYEHANAPPCGAIVRQWNADDTLSVCAFPHARRNVVFFDSVPRKGSERALAEDRPHHAVWDYPPGPEAAGEQAGKTFRDEIARLRDEVAELKKLIIE